MDYTVSVQRKKIHPYKFNLWVALASIVMFFGGLTSAYLVMRVRTTWVSFDLPKQFWVSTIIILFSSLTMHLAVKYFKQRNINRYKLFITITAILGVLFTLSQFWGFINLYSRGVKLDWNISAGLLYIITGMHMLHVLGGVVALLIMFARAFRRKIRSYDSIPVELAATYWHFVDILWIYLFLFFIWIR
jgi:cytochrome c oxidase subunit III